MKMKEIQKEFNQKLEMLGIGNMDLEKLALDSGEAEEQSAPIKLDILKRFFEASGDKNMVDEVTSILTYYDVLRLLGSPVEEVVASLTYNTGVKYEEHDDYPDEPGYMELPKWELTKEENPFQAGNSKLKKTEIEQMLLPMFYDLGLSFAATAILEEKGISWIKKKEKLMELLEGEKENLKETEQTIEEELNKLMKIILEEAEQGVRQLFFDKLRRDEEKKKNQKTKKPTKDISKQRKFREEAFEALALMGVTAFDIENVKRDGSIRKKSQALTVDLKVFERMMKLEQKSEVLEAIQAIQQVASYLADVKLKGKQPENENQRVVVNEVRERTLRIITDTNKKISKV